jgi:hypothetical protein
MSTKIRKNIIREAKNRIKNSSINFDELLGGEKEQLQDVTIEEICKERGYTLGNFYAINGKELNKFLNW